MTPRQWTVVAVVGVVLVMTGLVRNIDLSHGGFVIRVTTLMVFGAVLIVIAVLMRRMAVGRSRRAGEGLPPPPPPFDSVSYVSGRSGGEPWATD